jgi:hypothetical protein
MTKLLIGFALFIVLLLGLVMSVSVGMLGGSTASPTAQQDIPPATWPCTGRRQTAALACPGRCWLRSARLRPTTVGCRPRG